jgi:hypothetical protein
MHVVLLLNVEGAHIYHCRKYKHVTSASTNALRAGRLLRASRSSRPYGRRSAFQIVTLNDIVL